MAISNLSNGVRTGVCTSTNRPTTPYEGQVIYETDTDLSYVWGGTAWQQITGGTAVGNSGLVYVTSATIGTTVSSVAVASCFSSTYDNYRITVSSDSSSTNASLGMQLGASATGYYGFLTYGAYTASTILGANRNNQAQHNWIGGASVVGQPMIAILDIINPNKASHTHFGPSTYRESDNYGTMQGEHRVATAFTGFTILTGSGTITGGTITVYGYRKA